MKGEDAFYDDEGTRGDLVEGVGDAGVCGEVVAGAVNGVALGEGADVGDEELGLEGVGVVKILFVAVVEGELREIAVVPVERKERGVEGGGEFAGEGGFAGTGAAGDAEDDGAAGEGELFGLAHGFQCKGRSGYAGFAAEWRKGEMAACEAESAPSHERDRGVVRAWSA